jgi:hypothetical protein
MKIAFHSYQLGDRGTEICLYKYAKYNQEILGNESIIISTSSRPTPSLQRFNEFKTILYPDVWINDGKNDSLRSTLEKIVQSEKVDAFYAIKGGEDDGFMPKNCSRLAHAIFRMDQPHGDVYAGVCKYISDKYGSIHPYVYHIVDAPPEKGNLRNKLSIPHEALVFGRHGGKDTFSIDFVKLTIARALELRSDIYFLFLNTLPFISHERVIYLDTIIDETEKMKFVDTCDAMMHARLDGEIFSLSTAEFSIRNKPVITWDGYIPMYDRGHIEILKEKGIYYKNSQDLLDILVNIDKRYISSNDWNAYKNIFSAENVMKQFNDVFLSTKQ